MASFSVNPPNTTVTFTYTEATTKIQDTIFDAALYIASNKGLDISGYTNQQKLDLVDIEIKRHVVSLAKAQHRDSSIATAEVTAQTESSTKYGL